VWLSARDLPDVIRHVGISLLCVVALLSVPAARAASQLSFYLDKSNFLSGIGAAYLINKPGSASQDVILDVGDRLRGTFKINTIQVGGGGSTALSGGPVELTGIYDITVNRPGNRGGWLV
jgi:hypothetical protein